MDGPGQIRSWQSCHAGVCYVHRRSRRLLRRAIESSSNPNFARHFDRFLLEDLLLEMGVPEELLEERLLAAQLRLETPRNLESWKSCLFALCFIFRSLWLRPHTLKRSLQCPIQALNLRISPYLTCHQSQMFAGLETEYIVHEQTMKVQFSAFEAWTGLREPYLSYFSMWSVVSVWKHTNFDFWIQVRSQAVHRAEAIGLPQGGGFLDGYGYGYGYGQFCQKYCGDMPLSRHHSCDGLDRSIFHKRVLPFRTFDLTSRSVTKLSTLASH